MQRKSVLLWAHRQMLCLKNLFLCWFRMLLCPTTAYLTTSLHQGSTVQMLFATQTIQMIWTGQCSMNHSQVVAKVGPANLMVSSLTKIVCISVMSCEAPSLDFLTIDSFLATSASYSVNSSLRIICKTNYILPGRDGTEQTSVCTGNLTEDYSVHWVPQLPSACEGMAENLCLHQVKMMLFRASMHSPVYREWYCDIFFTDCWMWSLIEVQRPLCSIKQGRTLQPNLHEKCVRSITSILVTCSCGTL
jgi:hypothetical protein